MAGSLLSLVLPTQGHGCWRMGYPISKWRFLPFALHLPLHCFVAIAGFFKLIYFCWLNSFLAIRQRLVGIAMEPTSMEPESILVRLMQVNAPKVGDVLLSIVCNFVSRPPPTNETISLSGALCHSIAASMVHAYPRDSSTLPISGSLCGRSSGFYYLVSFHHWWGTHHFIIRNATDS